MDIAAAEVADRVMTLLPLPDAAMGLRENVAVTPLGRPTTVNVIAALNPVAPAVVKVTGTDPPRATLGVVALAVSEKLARTVRVRD